MDKNVLKVWVDNIFCDNRNFMARFFCNVSTIKNYCVQNNF